jgi:hypothetical protein
MSRSPRRPANTLHELGRHWRPVTALAGIAVGAVLTALVVPHLHPQPGVAAAAPAAVAVLLGVTLLTRADGRGPTPLTTRWTVQVLRRMGWVSAAGLSPDLADDSAVAIAPSAVLALRSVVLRLDRATDQLLAPEIAAAAGLAAAVSAAPSESRPSGLPVVPAVMVWGAGPAEFPGGYRVADGVHVLDGRRPQLWLHLFSTPQAGLVRGRELVSAA